MLRYKTLRVEIISADTEARGHDMVTLQDNYNLSQAKKYFFTRFRPEEILWQLGMLLAYIILIYFALCLDIPDI